VANAAIDYYQQWPDYARLVAQSQAMVGSPLTRFEESPDERVRESFRRAMGLETAKRG
jgi:hypothetical protein